MYLEMVKIEHTLFAAPFCLSALLVATGGRPSGRLLFWVVVALTSARSAAMAFNRIVDAPLDALNERTRGRHIPRGVIGRRAAAGFTAAAAALFVIAAWQINDLALALSPVALVVILGYSFTKRWTRWSHLVLGLSLSIAPVGAWIAARAQIELPPLVLAVGVVSWVAGFDILYALQDIAFDRREGLHSLPAALGPWRALWIARLLHAASAMALVGFGLAAGLGAAYFAGALLMAALITYEHALVRPDDLSRVNTAFFTVNGAVSLLFLASTAADIYLTRGATALP